jgi:hypothetical protein
MPWIAWLIAAVALGVAEYFTLTLAFGLLAAAALVAAIVAVWVAPCWRKSSPSRSRVRWGY